jgi:hypothetical protein
VVVEIIGSVIGEAVYAGGKIIELALETSKAVVNDVFNKVILGLYAKRGQRLTYRGTHYVSRSYCHRY